MKNQLLFAVLAVLVIFANGAVVKSKENVPEVVVTEVQDTGEAGVERFGTERNLDIGFVAPGDRLLSRTFWSKYAIFNTIQLQEVTFTANAGTTLTAIRAQEIGVPQFPTARLVAGGPGSMVATIQLSTARGYGYHYEVEFWGR